MRKTTILQKMYTRYTNETEKKRNRLRCFSGQCATTVKHNQGKRGKLKTTGNYDRRLQKSGVEGNCKKKDPQKGRAEEGTKRGSKKVTPASGREEGVSVKMGWERTPSRHMKPVSRTLKKGTCRRQGSKEKGPH